MLIESGVGRQHTLQPEFQKRITEPPLLPGWMTWSHGALIALLLVFWGILSSRTSFSEYAGSRDFLGLYVGARLIATGHAFQLYDVDAQREMMNIVIAPDHRTRLMPFVYPPYIALLLSPLAKFSLTTALAIWTGINISLAGITCATLLRLGSAWTERFALLAFALAWVPLHLTIIQGQLGLLTALGITGAIISIRNNRHVQAGFWLALGVFKPQLLVFPLVILAMWRRGRALVSFFAALAALTGISFAKFGFWPPNYFTFLREYSRLSEQASLYPSAMQNWRGMVFALLKTDTSTASLSLTLIFSLGSLVLLLWLCANPGQNTRSTSDPKRIPVWEPRFAMAILLGALSSPHLYLHDWVVAIPALSILLFSVGPISPDRSGRAIRWLIGLSPFAALAAQFNLLPGLSFIQLVPWYMALIVVAAFSDLRKNTKNTALGAVPGF
jgi:hypothetical protein